MSDPLFVPTRCSACGEPLSETRRRKPFWLNWWGTTMTVWACSSACVLSFAYSLPDRLMDKELFRT